MNKEREVLKKILATGWLNNELSNEVEELLAQPEQVEIAPSSTKLQDRIKDYLSMGGLFNPELVNHDIVRDLILDARAELLTQKREPLSDEEVIAKYRAITLYAPSYYAGFRDAEQAHGIIGGGND